ncbi:MAG TPA: outer membrane beta-barrel protein, partial [Puia sp.]|nr:outer membrane beta-barrel protein [Puia sp.]
MIHKIKLMLLVSTVYFSATAQDSIKAVMSSSKDTVAPSPSTTFSGSLDLYYRYNFANPSGSLNNYTSFTNSQNSFELGMATIPSSK